MAQMPFSLSWAVGMRIVRDSDQVWSLEISTGDDESDDSHDDDNDDTSSSPAAGSHTVVVADAWLPMRSMLVPRSLAVAYLRRDDILLVGGCGVFESHSLSLAMVLGDARRRRWQCLVCGADRVELDCSFRLCRRCDSRWRATMMPLWLPKRSGRRFVTMRRRWRTTGCFSSRGWQASRWHCSRHCDPVSTMPWPEWIPMPDMDVARCLPAAALWRGRLFVFGGLRVTEAQHCKAANCLTRVMEVAADCEHAGAIIRLCGRRSA